MSAIKKIAKALLFIVAFPTLAIAGSGLILRAPGNITVDLDVYTDDVPIVFGTGDDVSCMYDTFQTPDSFVCGLGQDSEAMMLMQAGDISTDFAFPDTNTPTLVIQNSDQTNVNKRIWLQHDGTNGIIDVGTGVVSMPDGITTAGKINFSSGVTVNGGNYEIVRDNDAINQLHFNAPSPGSMEFSFNDAPRVVITDDFIGSIFKLSMAATTTGFGIDVNDANSLTTGAIIRLVSNSGDSSGRNLAFIRNQNASATGTTPLTLQQDAANTAFVITQNAAGIGQLVTQNGNSVAIQINSSATSQNALRFNTTSQTSAAIISIPNADSLTTGNALNFVSNSPDASTRALVFIRNQNAGATSASTLRVQQDSTAGAFIIDRSATASSNGAMTVNDSGTGTGPSIQINKVGGSYGNAIGLINVVRTGSFTGINGEQANDIKILPNYTMTEPGAGSFDYHALDIDLTSLSVTAGAGSSSVSALHLVGSADADIGKSYSLLTGFGAVGLGGNIEFVTGTAIIAASYQVGRDSDGTNQLHFNVPTGATFEFSVNDTSEYTMSSTAMNVSNNTITNIGGAGTDFLSGGALTVGPTASAAGVTALTINQGSHTAITVDRPAIGISNFTNTVSTGSTIASTSALSVGQATYNGVAGGGTETITDAYSLIVQGPTITGSNITITNSGALLISSGSSRFRGRVLQTKGSDIAAANDLTLGSDGNFWTITGNTQINAITTSGWTAGSQMCLEFTGTPTVKHNTAGGGGTAPMLLSGAADFAATASDDMCFIYNGTNWKEISRTVI